MVRIECPHCDEEIELEDGSFGLFDCPHCENEFEWEGHHGDPDAHFEPFGEAATGFQFKKAGIILLLTVISMAIFTFFAFLLGGESLGDSVVWTFYAAILAAPVWIPVSFIPSILYLIACSLQSLQGR